MSGIKNEKICYISDDIFRKRNGSGPQYYDAFILYVDADRPFAEDIMNKMEQELGLKVK